MERERPARRLSNLTLRLITAAVALPLLVAVVWAGGWPFALVAGAIAFLAAAEFVHGWLIPSRPLPEILPQATTFSIAPVVVAGAHASPWFLAVGAGFAALFALLGYTRTDALGPRRQYRVLCWCVLYVGLLFSAVVLTRDLDSGREWVFLGILTTFAVDTGAYAVGKLLGRHKMAPSISPGKTWEGAAGGYVAGVAVCLVLNRMLDTGVPVETMAPFALSVPVAAMAGDLFESWMKRRMGVKDASGFLPGHGGFLDRMDSVLFVMPLLLLFLHVRVV